MPKFYYLFLVIILVAACAEPAPKEKKPPFQLPDNAVFLLAGDSAKTWKLAKRYNGKVRMNMAGCFMSYRQTFRPDSTMNDNNGQQANCGNSLHATWNFSQDSLDNHFLQLNSKQFPELLNINEEYKFFQIMNLSEEAFKLRFTHKQFTKTTTVITDYYIRDDVVVKDRDFHW